MGTLVTIYGAGALLVMIIAIAEYWWINVANQRGKIDRNMYETELYCMYGSDTKLFADSEKEFIVMSLVKLIIVPAIWPVVVLYNGYYIYIVTLRRKIKQFPNRGFAEMQGL